MKRLFSSPIALFVSLVLILAAVLLLALPGTALADEGGPPPNASAEEVPIDLSEPTTMPQIVIAVLMYLMGGGSLSFFFENADWFHRFASGNRRWIIVLVDVIVVGALAAVNEFVEPESLAKLTPYWNVIRPMVAVYFFSQVIHRLNKGKPVTADGRKEAA